MKHSPGWSSHLPVLSKVFKVTRGPILELGMGLYSTPFLHWMCAEVKRPLVSYEKEDYWIKTNHWFATKDHQIHHVKDWDKIDIEQPWEMAFIDHEPARRKIELARLANYAKYIVLHDTQPNQEKHYHYQEVYPMFKHIRHFGFSRAWTGVLSNFVDLSKL